MIRIIHAADLHLDSPFESLDAEKASVRRSEQRALLERIAAEVNQRNADLLFLAGDLLDSGSAYAETGEALLAALGKVRIPVFIAPGNHDWYSRRSPYALLPFPDNVHIFRTPHLESVCLPELGARVWGAGYTSPSCEALLRGFHAPAEEGVTQLLVLHAEPGRARLAVLPGDGGGALAKRHTICRARSHPSGERPAPCRKLLLCLAGLPGGARL